MSNRPWLDVAVYRGELIESLHHVAACAVDTRGTVRFGAGDIDAPVYLRSTAKPFIAATAVAAGVVQRFGLTSQEIAVMAASHSGEPFHIEAVRSILKKIGLPETALQCGAHPPYNEGAAKALEREGIAYTAVHNNCSGKHAGILALCLSIGADPATYLDAANPAQARILDFCARASDQRAEDFILGVDGCGIPVYATPLRNAAISFMKLASLRGMPENDLAAMRVVREAMIAHPAFVSGTGEFDARVMQTAAGAIACKSGAEGVHGSAHLPSGTGLVCKVIDGAGRGRGPAVLTALRELGLLGQPAAEVLADLERPVVYNRAGLPVGMIRASGNFAVSSAS